MIHITLLITPNITHINSSLVRRLSLGRRSSQSESINTTNIYSTSSSSICAICPILYSTVLFSSRTVVSCAESSPKAKDSVNIVKQLVTQYDHETIYNCYTHMAPSVASLHHRGANHQQAQQQEHKQICIHDRTLKAAVKCFYLLLQRCETTGVGIVIHVETKNVFALLILPADQMLTTAGAVLSISLYCLPFIAAKLATVP